MVVRGLPGDVVAVVGGQRRDAELAADLQQAFAHPGLDRQPVIHDFEEEVLRAEDLPPLGGGLQRLALMSQPQPGLHLAGRAARGGDDARGMLGHDLGVHPGPLAQLAFEGGQRGQFEQVAQPGGVLGHQRHVQVGTAGRDVVGLLAGIAPGDAPGVETRRRGDIGLHPDDRLDPDVGGGVVELAGTEHVSVVGHTDRGHLQALGLGQHGTDLGGAVQHRILGVVVQMYERAAGTHRPVSLEPSADTSPAPAPGVWEVSGSSRRAVPGVSFQRVSCAPGRAAARSARDRRSASTLKTASASQINAKPTQRAVGIGS